MAISLITAVISRASVAGLTMMQFANQLSAVTVYASNAVMIGSSMQAMSGISGYKFDGTVLSKEEAEQRIKDGSCNMTLGLQGVMLGQYVQNITFKSNVKQQNTLINNKVRVEVDEKKFSDYILDPNNSNGKSKIFKSYGYDSSDSAELTQLYQMQAKEKYMSGNYSLGKFDQYGQRITIEINIGKGSIQTLAQSGWMIKTDGSIRLIAPFAGFVK